MQSLAYLIGAGSMSLGAEAAGAHIVKVLETPGYSKNAQTWDLNRPHQAHEVLGLDWQSEEFTRYRGLDLVYGNPPCGGLSAMTCSRIGSPTNNCMRQWVRMVVKASPRMILMENAFQLATPRIKPLLDDLQQVLGEAGYWSWTWLFYSYQIGTPQFRRRMFLCASLDKPVHDEYIFLNDLPDHRDKSSSPCGPYLKDLVGVAPSIDPVVTLEGKTVTQHCYNKYGAEMDEACRNNWERVQTSYLTTNQYQSLLNKAASGDERAVKDAKKWADKVWPDCPPALDGMNMFRPAVLRADRCAPAIIGGMKYLSPFERRVLTFREMARLMGYPDEWEFHKIDPSLIAQGVPVNSTRWALDRMLKVLGQSDKKYAN